MKSDLNLQEVSASDWQEFQRRSPQQSVFTSIDYLESLGCTTNFLLVRKNGKTIAGFPALTSGSTPEIPPFAVSAGIHYADFEEIKAHSRNGLCHEIHEFLAQALFEKYDNVNFANHHSVTDMRGFDWFNYGETDRKGGYDVSIRYTTHVRLGTGDPSTQYSQLRRRDIRSARKLGVKVVTSASLQDLDRLHDLTFRRQGIVRKECEVSALENIVQRMLGIGRGWLSEARIGTRVVSASFWLLGENIAHYLIGANDPDYRKTGAGTLCLHDAMEEMHKSRGIEFFDLVGINSPQRGAFKLSFGGTIIPYLTVTKRKPLQVAQS